jgi:hypothetical protein
MQTYFTPLLCVGRGEIDLKLSHSRTASTSIGVLPHPLRLHPVPCCCYCHLCVVVCVWRESGGCKNLFKGALSTCSSQGNGGTGGPARVLVSALPVRLSSAGEQGCI